MIRDLCEGQLEGGEIGSTEITFTPGKIKGGTHIADTKTAGYVFVHVTINVVTVVTCFFNCRRRIGGEHKEFIL